MRPVERIAFRAVIDTSDRNVAADVLRRWLRHCGLDGEIAITAAGLRFATATADLSCRLTDAGPGTASFFLLDGSFLPVADGPGLQLGALAPLCQAANLGYGVRYVPARPAGRPGKPGQPAQPEYSGERMLAARLLAAQLKDAPPPGRPCGDQAR
jgi:hypothetical protein